MKDLIEVALGNKPADIVLKNGKIINTISGEIYESSVAIYKDKIVGVHQDYNGKENIDCKGKYISPGFIDGHVHIESSMLSVEEFARAIVPRGTTTIIADPHEIANVAGKEGIEYILEASKNIPLNVYIMLPSCVPATFLETSGAVLNAKDLEPMFKYKNVLGLGEFMNFPGVINGFDDVIEKLELGKDHIIDGHAPNLTGKELCAYIASGVSSDHECITVKEALEKLRLGMYIMIREGSATKNLYDLLPLINKFNSRKCILATDDRHPEDIIKYGHIDFIVKEIIKEQENIIRAVRLATLNPAEHYKLDHLGGIAPGYIADLLVIDDINEFKISKVIKDGTIVAENGQPIFNIPNNENTLKDTMNISCISKDKLEIDVKGSKIRVIEIVPDQIITKNIICNVKEKNSKAISDIEKDILKLVVIERHKNTGNIGKGFVKGIGLKKGAIATSIAHDSHNIICVGCNDESMTTAINAVIKAGGGIAIAHNDKLLDILELPIAGLMSNISVEEISRKIANIHKICYDLGTNLNSPMLTLSFLALPVIPSLKLTDKGLVDVEKFNFVDIFIGE